MTTPPPIVLASASQRRQQFLRDLGLTFTALATDIDETPLPGEAPDAMTLRLAVGKAQAAAARLPASPALVIASDTTVAMDGVIYGKPEDAADATRMLRDLRGRGHQVFSALCVLRLPDGVQHTCVNYTELQMRDYTDAEIAVYVASGDPLDKAGAYGIQTAPFRPVSALRGCFASVMGLPLADLRDLLASFDVAMQVPVDGVCRRYSGAMCCAAAAAGGMLDQPIC